MQKILMIGPRILENRKIGAFEELGRGLDEIGNVQLRRLGGKITQFRKEIKGKQKDIQKLRKKW